MSRLIESTLTGKISSMLLESENEKHICPRCGKTYTDFPALSRVDNETEICPDCGTDEAMLQYMGEPLSSPTAFRDSLRDTNVDTEEVEECSKPITESDSKDLDIDRVVRFIVNYDPYSFRDNYSDKGNNDAEMREALANDISKDLDSAKEYLQQIVDANESDESDIEEAKGILKDVFNVINEAAKPAEKEYELVHADSDKISELENGSAFTWEGIRTEEEDLKGIVDFFKKETKGFKTPVTMYTWSGKEMNEKYGLTGSNAYPDDLTFLSLSLDSWSEMGNLPIIKLQVGARWLDDIVDNNASREGKNECDNRVFESCIKDKKSTAEERLAELKLAIQDGVSDDEKEAMEKEIAELEKCINECGYSRKQALEEGWSGTIKSGADLRKLLNTVDEDATAEECRKVLDALKVCCEEAKTLTKDDYYKNGFQSIIDDIEMIYDDEDLESSNVDWELDGFFDWCDASNLWCELTESNVDGLNNGTESIDEIKAHIEDIKSVLDSEGSIDADLLKAKVEELLRLIDEHKSIMNKLTEDSYDEGIFQAIENALWDAGLEATRFSDAGVLTRNLGWCVSNSEGEVQLQCNGTYLDESGKLKESSDFGDYNKLKQEVETVVHNVFDGTDFTVSEVDINDGTVSFNVTAFAPSDNKDGSVEMSREVKLEVPELNYLDAVSNACYDWVSEHSTPDAFYESALNESKEGSQEMKFDLIDAVKNCLKRYKSSFKGSDIKQMREVIKSALDYTNNYFEKEDFMSYINESAKLKEAYDDDDDFSTEPKRNRKWGFKDRVLYAYDYAPRSIRQDMPTVTDIIVYLDLDDTSENRDKVRNIIFKAGKDWQLEGSLNESAEEIKAFWGKGFKPGDKVKSSGAGEVEILDLNKDKDYILIKRQADYQPYVAAWAPQYKDEEIYWGQGHYFDKEEDAKEYFNNKLNESTSLNESVIDILGISEEDLYNKLKNTPELDDYENFNFDKDFNKVYVDNKKTGKRAVFKLVLTPTDGTPNLEGYKMREPDELQLEKPFLIIDNDKLEESVTVVTADGSSVNTQDVASVSVDDTCTTVVTDSTTVTICNDGPVENELLPAEAEEVIDEPIEEVPTEEIPVEETPIEEPVEEVPSEDEVVEESDELESEESDDIVNVKSLSVVKNQGNIFMLTYKDENDEEHYVVCENFNNETNEGDEAETYSNKEEADKDYFERLDINNS